MHDLDRRLAPTLAAQLSLVTRKQVLASGATPAAITRRLNSGRWVRAERGVYGLSGVAWTWRRNLAALVLSQRGAVASHRAAGRLLGAVGDDRGESPFEMSVPTDRYPQRDFELTRTREPHASIIVHESQDLTAMGSVLVDGIPTASPLRLVLELGAVISFDRYRRAVGVLRREHGVDWISMERTYRSFHARGRNGCGPLSELLDRHFGENGAPDEVVEIRCADLLVAAGLPTPQHQYSVVRPDGQIARFDLAYPELRVGIETDGRIHGSEEVRQSDNMRRNNLQLLGWTVYHFTWEDVIYRPEYVATTIRSALSSRSPEISA